LKGQSLPSFQKHLSLPLVISRSVFNALGIFEQLAARALEQAGDVHIIEDEDQKGG
jgi:hypothetical protein